MNKAFLFPGQGSQSPNMGEALFSRHDAAKRVLSLGSEAAERDLRALLFETSEEELSRTDNAQLAIFTLSMAYLAVLAEKGFVPSAAAGFSLGECSALCAAGVFGPEDGFRLVSLRGSLMYEAAQRSDGAMAAVLGLSDAEVEEVCKRTDGYVVPVNYNCPGQLVIAGDRAAVGRACEACLAAGAKRALPLGLSGAFHSSYMEEAAARFAEGIASLSFSAPALPVYTNLTGGRLAVGPDALPAHLAAQITHPVRWETLMRTLLADGFADCVELGESKTLQGFAKRIDKSVACAPASELTDAGA